MPTIPSLTSPQVAPAIPPLVKPFAPGPLSFGYGLGQGLVALGGSMENVEQREQLRTDRSAALSAYADARALRGQILYDGETGLARQRGRNYLDAAQEADKRWTEGIAGISARLSPEQQEVFDERMESLRAGFADDIAEGVSRARVDLYDDEMEKVLKQTGQDALADVSHGKVGLDAAGAVNDVVIGKALAEFEAKDGALDTYAPHMAEKWGVSESEARTRMQAEYASALHVQTVDALLARNDAMAAQAYFAKHQDAILDPEARIRLTAQTEKNSLEAVTESAATLILEEASQTGKDGLPPSQSDQRAAIKAALEQVPPERRKAVRDRVDELEAEADEDLRVAQAKNFDELHAELQGGTPLAEIERTPIFNKTDEGGISPGQRDALRIYSQNKTKGAYAATNPEVWGRLSKQLKENPSALGKVNVRELTASGQLSDDDAREVLSWQDQIRKAAAGDAGAADALKLSLTRLQTTERWAQAINLGATAAAKFDLRVKEAERRHQKVSGVAMTDEQYDTLVRRMAVDVSIDRPWNPFDKDVFLYAATPEDLAALEADPEGLDFEAISPADVDEVTAALIEAGQPTDPERVKLEWIRYVRRLREAGGE
jgi:hypothetical protein